MLYELLDGTTGELDDIIITNSKVIQNLIKNYGNINTIPITSSSFTKDTIKNAEMLIRYIIINNYSFEIDKLLMSNKECVNLLNLADFLDIEIIRVYLIDHLANYIRNNGLIEELFNMF